MKRHPLRSKLVAAVAAVLSAATLVAVPAGAHPDPMDKHHVRNAAGPVVRVNSPSGLAGDLAAVQWGDTGAIAEQTAELVFAGTGCSPLSYAGVDVEGKIALIQADAGDPCPVATFAQRVQSAQRAGAIGLVAVPREGREPSGNATAITAEIPALEVFRTDAVNTVLAAVQAGDVVEVTLTDTREPLAAMGETPCVDGTAGPFACDGIDLLSFLPKDTFEGGDLSDIWGWTDEEEGGEYVMFGTTDGVAFVRVTDPTAPVYLGKLPNQAVVQEIWHDIKVYEDHAFIVSESSPHGMVVFDLTRLREADGPQEWTADTRYPFNVSAHNIAINEDTGYAYIVGGSAALVAPDQCLSGLHMVDIRNPKSPTFAGCYLMDGGPGTAARVAGSSEGAAYVHDTQCVVYDGPDTRYTGRELCFNAAEDQVTIADVTDKANPVTVGTTDYDGIAYAHQGWLTEDHAFLLTNDELDELGGVENTRTIILDVRDLENPEMHAIHNHPTASIDHNNYVLDGRVYQSNYTTGLRVLSVDSVEAGRLDPVAFFDTYPFSDGVTFDGTWSNYPYFESGTIAVTGIGDGLFLLRMQDQGDDAPGNGKGKGKGRPEFPGGSGRGPAGAIRYL